MNLLSSLISAETPRYNASQQSELFQQNKPEGPPQDKDSKKYKYLLRFCNEVEYILQTVNENEYQAATTFMSAPDEMFSKAVVFPNNAMVVGLFGKTRVKAALIQTEPGVNVDDYIEDAIEAYPNAKYVIGVGICYAFDSSKYLFGDVIVSSKIADFANYKAKTKNQGKKIAIEDRGETKSVDKDLHKVFCLGLACSPEYPVTQGRVSKVTAGTLISPPILMSNEEFRDEFHDARDMAIGGEMEGGQLMKFVSKQKRRNKDNHLRGIIMIKGVADYGDEDKALGKQWQFTAAMAALHYIEQKLGNVVSPGNEKLNYCDWSCKFVISIFLAIIAAMLLYYYY